MGTVVDADSGDVRPAEAILVLAPSPGARCYQGFHIEPLTHRIGTAQQGLDGKLAAAYKEGN